MIKHYLAFKAVRNDFTSIWIGGRLRRKYTIGKTLRSHTAFPMFLIEHYPADNWNIRCGAPYDKIILVRVPDNHICRQVPFARTTAWSDEPHNVLPRNVLRDEWKSLNVLCQFMDYSAGLGATRLTVLREVDMKYASAKEAAEAYSAKYAIPFITLPIS